MNYVDNPPITPVGMSICTGMRGLERGVEQALRLLRYGNPFFGEAEARHRVLKIAVTMEIEAVVALNLAKEMEDGLVDACPVFTDLTQFPWGAFHNRIHLLTGGYPCQPFSSAGQQQGVLDPRHLFPYIDRGIAAVRPVVCFFENVANHLNLGYEEVRGRLHDLGYQVEEGIFAAEQVGAPHLRRRLFIMAVANAYCTEQSKRRGYLAEVLGIPKVKRSDLGAAISGGNGDQMVGTMADSESLPIPRGLRHVHQEDAEFRQSKEQHENKRSMFGDACEELDNPSGLGHSQSNGQIQAGRDAAELTSKNMAISSGFGQREQGDGVQGEPRSSELSGGEMDYPQHQRLERYFGHVSLKTRWQAQIRSIASSSLWPSGQGPDQHGWEPNRLESSMGYVVDGHDFTEDLLRMAGNAVVPQQACAAFLTLLAKFL